jgi:hypothetical protein
LSDEPTRNDEDRPADSSRGDKRPVVQAAVYAALITGIIGAGATVLAAVIGHAQGQNEAGAAPKPTVTVTATATVTATPSPSGGSTSTGGARPGSHPGAGQGGQVRTMEVPISDGVGTGIDFDSGQVIPAGDGEMQYAVTETGTPELTGYNIYPYSVDVTSRNAGQEQCSMATTSDPDPKPITAFHKGLLFCVQFDTGRQVALLEQTKALGSSKTLNLRETIWPNLNSG